MIFRNRFIVAGLSVKLDGIELSITCVQLKLVSGYGKKYPIDSRDKENVSGIRC
jgi:hypothetical protein